MDPQREGYAGTTAGSQGFGQVRPCCDDDRKVEVFDRRPHAFFQGRGSAFGSVQMSRAVGQ